jgi:hypothetical protein
MCLVIHGDCVPAGEKLVKRESYNSRHVYFTLASEFFDAKLIIFIAFTEKPGEGLTQVIGFKIWPRIGY